MARKATKDTFAMVDEGGGTMRRVKVFAGDTIPDQFQVEEKGAVEGDTDEDQALAREQAAVDAGTQDASASRTGKSSSSGQKSK